MDNPSSAAPKYPKGIPFIVGNEGAERFSFYGMKAILYMYLTSLFLGFQDQGLLDPAVVGAAKAHATQVNHLFIAGVYAFPMLGAIIADRLLGKYRVILWVSLVYCLGHAVLAVAGRAGSMGNLEVARGGMFLGLALIAMGSGGIKPCVSANVGDQFTKDNEKLVSRVYQIFYFMINFGSFFSTLLTPVLYKKLGAEVAFGVPGILMGVATIVFWLGRKRFVQVPPNPGGRLGRLDALASSLLFTPIAVIIYAFFVGGHSQEQVGVNVGALVGYVAISIAGVVAGLLIAGRRQRQQEDAGFIAVLVYAFRHQKERQAGEKFFDVARKHFGEESADGPPAVLRIMLVFSMVSVFWALFDQHSSTWIEQASKMDLGLALPHFVGLYGIWGTVALAAWGGIWLMLHVSNLQPSRLVSLAPLGLYAVGFAVAGMADRVLHTELTQLTLDPSQLSALNPLMVMLIIPMLNLLVYQPLEKRGVVLKPLFRMAVGMFLASVAFGIAWALQLKIETSTDRVHALWQAVQYLVMTTAEVLVSVNGLEFAYTQAPRKMKSTIMGFWLICVTAGNMLVAALAPLQQRIPLSMFFLLFAGIMAVAAVIFSALAARYRGKSYLQQQSA